MPRLACAVAVLFGLLAIACGRSQPSPQPATPVAPVEEKATDSPAEADTGRAVAVTIDDLPTVRGRTAARRARITAGLLGHLTAFDVPAVGFVNESKLGRPPQPERIALLEQWLDAGLDLGNHTYAHPNFYTTPLDDYQADVVRGEPVTAGLLTERGARLRYFRHPYLNTGPDGETKAAFERFLDRRGYTVAPVTIDNDEYVYALAYDRAQSAGDDALAARIGRDYVRYMDEMFAFYERLARDLLGREPAQILLLHANALNADYLDGLARMMQARGYRFISLGAALQDSAYALPDRYAGPRGLSWLQRWWTTEGRPLRAEPDPPEWVLETAYPDRN